MAALATTIITSAIYDFLKFLLTKTAERDFFEKALRESFGKVTNRLSVEPGVWAELTLGKSIQLLNGLIGCLQSPDIDRDEALRVLEEELEEEGLSSGEAEKFYSMIFEEFNAIADKEAVKKPEVFRAIMLHKCEEHGIRLDDIADDLNALRNQIPNIVRLVSEAIKPQLDRIEAHERRIEEKVTRINEERRVIVPTIQSVLRRNDPEISEGMFFRKEPAWVDFEEGFIVERKEVDEIIERLKKCNVHLVVGESAAGKSVVLKNVGFKLAKRNPHVYYIGLKTESDRLKPCFEQVLRMKKGKPVLIIDDAHLQPSACERLIRELRRAETKMHACKVLFGSRPIAGTIWRSPKESSAFEYLSKSSLRAEDASSGVIELFLKRRHDFNKKRITKASKKFSKYRRDLWILSWALETFDPESDSVDEELIYERIRDSIRGMEPGAEDILLPLSVFYQYEIPIDRSLLVGKIGLEETMINRLIEQSEIIQVERIRKQRSLSFVHSSIAKLYLETYQNYPSLGENVREQFRGNDIEYEMFCWCMLESDPAHSLNIINNLAMTSYKGFFFLSARGQKLLLKLLENGKIIDQIRKGIKKEKDLGEITLLMHSLGSGSRELRHRLVTCILHKRFPDAVWPKLASETDLDKITSFLLAFSLSHERAPHGLKSPETNHFNSIASSLDYHILLRKIDMERDVDKIQRCITNANLFDNELGQILVHSLDLDDLSSKLQKEGNMSKIIFLIYTVADMDEELGFSLAKRVDFSKVKVKYEDLGTLFLLRDLSSRLRLEIERNLNPEVKEAMMELWRQSDALRARLFPRGKTGRVLGGDN